MIDVVPAVSVVVPHESCLHVDRSPPPRLVACVHLLARALVHPLPVKLEEPVRARSGEIRTSSRRAKRERSQSG
eukprot:scaffold15987_cov67-Phaeocystis_antarctica.AAC.1